MAKKKEVPKKKNTKGTRNNKGTIGNKGNRSPWQTKLDKPLGRGLGSGKGVARSIETPEKLWELFEEYREWSKSTPYQVHTHTVRGVKQYQDKERVLTYIGFEGWLCMNNIVYDLTHYEVTKGTKDLKSVDYRAIIAKIKKVCTLDTVTGASAGVYNANLASRLEGLSEKTEVKVEDNRKEVSDLFPLDDGATNGKKGN